MGLQNLADVHPARHAERIQHDLDRSAVRQVRHVLLGQDARNDALVAVAPGHLVAHLQLALHGHEDLDQLDHARRQLVALLQQLDLLLVDPVHDLDVGVGALVDRAHFLQQVFLLQRQGQDLLSRQLLEMPVLDRLLRLQVPLALPVLHRGGRLQTDQKIGDLLVPFLVHDPRLITDVLFQPADFLLLDFECPLVLVDALAGEDLDFDDRAVDSRRCLQAGVADVSGLLAEDGPQQLLLRCELGFALRRDLAHQDVAGLDRSADANDAAVVEIGERRLGDVGNVARDLLGPQLRVPRLDLELLDVNRGVGVVAHQALRDEDRILEVVTAPRHEGHEHVPAQRQLTQLGGGAVGQDLAADHPLTLADDRFLVHAGVLIRPAELGQLVDVGPKLARRTRFGVRALDPDDHPVRVHRVDDPGPLAEHHRTRVAGHDPLETRADDRRVGAQQRHRLPLHVRTHQGPVRVVVLQERNQGRGHADELLRADVHVVDPFAVDRDEVPAGTRHRTFVLEETPVVDLRVGLGDDVLLLLPGGQVEGVRFGLHLPLLVPLEAPVLRRQIVAGDDLAQGERAVARLDHLEVVDDPAALDLLVGTLDEAVVVDPRIGRERGDQADVRPLRGFDGADAAVVRRVDVAHFEARAFTRQAARTQRRQAPLVGDLGQRVRLVHELGELRRTEELLDRRDHGLRVDQVVRHRRIDVLMHGHLLLDRPLHAHQADPELVLEQFAHRAHAAVAEVVDVVDAANVLLQLQEVLDHPVEVLGREGLPVDRLVGLELDVELEAADPREVVSLRVEEHAVEQRTRTLVRRRVAGTHPPVDLDLRLLRVPGGVLGQGVRNRRAAELPIRKEDLQLAVIAAVKPFVEILRNRLVGLQQHFTGVLVDHIGDQEGALQFRWTDLRLDMVAGVQALDRRFVQGQAGEDAVAVPDAPARAVAQSLTLQHFRSDTQTIDAAPHQGEGHRGVELPQDQLVRLQAEGTQEDGAVELPFAIDPDRQDVLLVVLELHPGAPVGDDLRQVDALVAGEEHARAAVELADDHPLRPIDDEGAGVGHQRDLAEVDLLFLRIAHHPRSRLRVLVVDEETERDLERYGIGHAALPALRDRVLVLQFHRSAAGVALGDPVGVHRAAARAADAVLERVVGHDLLAAVRAGHAQILESLQLAAAAMPVADGVADEVERAGLPEVPEREDAGEHGLQAVIGPLLGQLVHLQEPVVGTALNADQVRNRQGRLDGRKVHPTVAVSVSVTVLRFAVVRHASISPTSSPLREPGARKVL